MFDGVLVAAECALALQAAVGAIDLAAPGLPPVIGLRLGLHYGPVYECNDSVLKQWNYFAVHVSKAARVEPITPQGCAHVTEPTAAFLALSGEIRFTCDYVGTIPAARDYGEFSMYSLGLA